MSPRGIFTHDGIILHCLGQDMQVLYLGRAPRTKETLPEFLKWRQITRPPLVFRGLTGSQRTLGFGVSLKKFMFLHSLGVVNSLLTVYVFFFFSISLIFFFLPFSHWNVFIYFLGEISDKFSMLLIRKKLYKLYVM